MSLSGTAMTQVWAHRGASHDGPENTLPAFSLAIKQRADGIELDVQRTADGVMVVCHDERLQRTSNGRGKLSEWLFADLRRLDFSYRNCELAPVRIPTLDEVLELIAPTRMVINIELKNSVVRYKGMEAEVIAAVDNASVADRVLYSSFNHRSVREIAAMDRPAGVLFSDVLASPERYARSIGAVALHPGVNVLRMDTRLIDRAHDAGLAVNVWTVDDRVTLSGLVTAGADAVISNRPDVAIKVRDEVTVG